MKIFHGRPRLALAALLAVLLFHPSPAPAESTLGYSSDGGTFDGGGGISNSENYLNVSSIAQPSPVGEAGSESYTADGGSLAVDNPTIIYNFFGFLPPVDNLPTLNVAKAGSAIPVKFSLDGNWGLDIFASGYPGSYVVSCTTTADTDSIEETVTAGGSGLSYDFTTDQYTYVWKTEKAWAGRCRQLAVKLADGTFHRANFKFSK